MASKSQQDDFGPRIQSYGELPETPPAHIWAFKALRNQLLGTRQTPPVTGASFEDEIDEVLQF